MSVHYITVCALLSIWDMNFGFVCYLESLQDLLLILWSSARNIRVVTTKQIDGPCSNIWSVALWEIFSSQTSLYFYSGPCSVLSQFWRWQMCFFREHKAVCSRYRNAHYCVEHRFGKTITNISVFNQTLPKVGNIVSVIMFTKSNRIISPMRYSNQWLAIWWKIYRSIMRTSELINTVYKC